MSDQQHEDSSQQKICLDETQPFITSSSPRNINRQRLNYTILPEEYSIIEETNNTSTDWNPDEAFNDVCSEEEEEEEERTTNATVDFVLFCRVFN
jgi:hypothetical protein